MISRVRGCGGSAVKALLLAAGVWGLLGPSARADGWFGLPDPSAAPGFQGFGLGYHLGYGYGGDALGVGAAGGYPHYAGPGYPNGEPMLNRCGPATPFPYFGGPGGPSTSFPQFFGGTGPLVIEKPVITIRETGNAPDPTTAYGQFSGTIPYPETRFAPFAGETSAGASGRKPSSSDTTAPANGRGQPSASLPPALVETAQLLARGRSLGIAVESVVDGNGVRCLEISKVAPGTVADKAGLHPGDALHSINGYRTEQAGNLTWIIANAAPNNVLKMSVRAASDAKEHTITAQLP